MVERVPVGPHLVELGLPLVTDGLLLVKGFKVLVEAPFLIWLLFELYLPDMTDHRF